MTFKCLLAVPVPTSAIAKRTLTKALLPVDTYVAGTICCAFTGTSVKYTRQDRPCAHLELDGFAVHGGHTLQAVAPRELACWPSPRAASRSRGSRYDA